MKTKQSAEYFINSGKFMKQSSLTTQAVMMSKGSIIYNYNALLDRAFKQLPEKRTYRERFEIPKAEVLVIGRKIVIQNFMEICNILNRDPKHLLKYLLRELGAPGYLEGRMAIIHGEHRKRTIDAIIERYVKNYVLCPVCGEPDTILIREKRMLYLQCQACGARSSVRMIK